MRLHCEFSTAVNRQELCDFIRSLTVTVYAFDRDFVTEHVVGRMAIDQILWGCAIDSGVSAFDVCDADSQGLHDVYSILATPKGNFRRSLEIGEFTDYVLFLYKAVFHPVIQARRQEIINAVFDMFGSTTLAVMWKETSGLSESELHELGFRKIANSELIYRHMALKVPFEDREKPCVHDEDLRAAAEHEDWVKRQWVAQGSSGA